VDYKMSRNPVVMAGSAMTSMPRMRKSWLRTCEMPIDLLQMSHYAQPGPPVTKSVPSITDLAVPLSLLELVGPDEDAPNVKPETLQELEATFLRGLQLSGDCGEQDLSFWNEVDSEFNIALPATAAARQRHGDIVPSLTLPKTHTTEPRRRKKINHAIHNPAHQNQKGATTREDLQPFLGAQLKKNLAKQGLERQNLSLQPDEWDDEVVVNMLGTNFANKREERIAKHQQWYNKNLSSAFVKKAHEAQQRESHTIEKEEMDRLVSQGRVSVVVCNKDDWRASKTKSLLSAGPSMLLFAQHNNDVSLSDLFRSREHRVEMRHGVPVRELQSSASSRSSSCPLLLAPNACDRLRQSTRFLQV